MKWPPYLMKLHFVNGEHRFGLWLPLFVIGPVVLVFLLVIFLVMLPFAILAFVFTWEWEWLQWLFLGIAAIFRVLSSLPGLTIDVDTKEVKVNIAIY